MKFLCSGSYEKSVKFISVQNFESQFLFLEHHNSKKS